MKSCLSGKHAWLSVKRILRPDTVTKVVLRALSRINSSRSCISEAVLQLSDTDKSVLVFHVTTSLRHHVDVVTRAT
jgi:chaperone required for assembly of F1-ATPase